MSAIDLVVLILGIALTLRAILSAIRTFVLPRAVNDTIARWVFLGTRRVFDVLARPTLPFAERERWMAYFGPVAIIVLPMAWIVMVGVGFAMIFWGLGARPVTEAFYLSGSSLLTLGFTRPDVHGGHVAAFTEAVIGLGLVALLIAYLPTIYSAFSRRELLVSLLEVRADSPPSPVVLITRMHRLGGLGQLHELWERWESWFAELSETHTSLTVLVNFRSQRPDHSWVNAAGAMMDTAAFVRSSVAVPLDPQADLMIRAGYLAVRRIAAAFHLPFDHDPRPDAATRIDRATFDRAFEVMTEAGVPMVPDRDRAWRDFNGWRVTYDAALLGLQSLTMAPEPWWTREIRSAWMTDEPRD
jgi:hypothetical protein